MINWEELINERNEWVAHNFPKSRVPRPGESVMGVFEEAGELTHSHLKRLQEIRGEQPFHIAQGKNAIGDITIYLLGVMAAHNFIPREPNRNLIALWRTYIKDEHGALYFIQECAGGISRYHSQNSPAEVQHWTYKLVWGMYEYCQYMGWDYEQIVDEVWAEVSARDWIKYPDTGMPPEE